MTALELKNGQQFQESLSRNLQYTEDDQYLGRIFCRRSRNPCLCLQAYPCESLSTNSSTRLWCCSNAACSNQRSASTPRTGYSTYLFHQMLFFGSRCERLCMVQFALISLIPGLLRRLEDCADPEFDSYERSLVTPTSLKTSDRNSCMLTTSILIRRLLIKR